ncbi:6-phosphogluconolactonase [Bifidobacterium aquikefiri]|uniref:6-phosphogluconolactonase n=1 Tax=Bifidobacterium aquikefiri TaxID=1653207 RepID=A0A261G934_9BIFI|nr:6-phosphogluconolactonase [Bifidobacterium aquikefiri]OZG67723.1 6-phosphogluconolactonase [Bifidobacterium aquikefiri]
MTETASVSMRRVIQYASPELMHKATAERFLLELSDRLAAGPRVDVALTGGTDGTAVLKAVAESPLNDAVDWSRVHLWWGDERFVAADSPDRNAQQARETWFGKLIDDGLMPASHVHEMPADTRTETETSSSSDEDDVTLLNRAADEYDRELVYELGMHPKLDVAMFGVGPDGHFASLFPDFPEIRIDDPRKRVVGITHSPKLPPLRLTLTSPFIRSSDKVWMLAGSEGKAKAVAGALSGVNNPHVPSSFAAGEHETLWLITKASAKLL